MTRTVKWLRSVFFLFLWKRRKGGEEGPYGHVLRAGVIWKGERAGRERGEKGVDPSCVVLPESSVNVERRGVALCVVCYGVFTSYCARPTWSSISVKELNFFSFLIPSFFPSFSSTCKHHEQSLQNKRLRKGYRFRGGPPEVSLTFPLPRRFAKDSTILFSRLSSRLIFKGPTTLLDITKLSLIGSTLWNSMYVVLKKEKER